MKSAPRTRSLLDVRPGKFNLHEVRLVEGISRLLLLGAKRLEQKTTKITK
jgi:hypothetical protein